MKSSLFLLLILAGPLSGNTFAQPSCALPNTRTWVHMTETTGFILDTLWFGFDTSATYGIDSHLCEFEVPFPIPETSCDSRFGNIPGHEGQPAPLGLGNGTYRDFRRYSIVTQIDTHRFNFGANWTTQFVLHWSPSSMRAVCDSVILEDIFGGILLRMRLDLADSLIMPPGFNQYSLLLYGARQLTTGIGDKSTDNPRSFYLAQNFPNPFNPSTTISFLAPHSSFITLKVYNVLGQEVRTLVNEKLDAGEHRVMFDAEGLPGGLYFYRLTSGYFTETKKMLILR